MPARTSIMIGWLVLLGASFALFLFVALLAWWQRRRLAPGRAERAAARAEWTAHAAAVAERFAEAQARLAAARQEAEQAGHAAARAWQELEQAQQAADAADLAYREAAEGRTADPAAASGPREVASAALAAYKRGDLSQEQLLAVWRWGSGWDPELERREQELRRLRAVRREAYGRYRAAASRERAATERADLAAAEVRALAEEAEVAAGQLARWEA